MLTLELDLDLDLDIHLDLELDLELELFCLSIGQDWTKGHGKTGTNIIFRTSLVMSSYFMQLLWL